MSSLINFYKTCKLIKADWNRYTGYWWNPIIFIPKMYVHPGMLFSLLYRLERYFLYESNYIFKLLGFLLYPIYFFITYYILSYHIEPKVKIGGGLFLHNREIVMTENLVIGRNFNCMGQTTIGKDLFKDTNITIGNNVTLGVGAKIVGKGKLEIASDVIIGANAVVTKSLLVKKGIYVGIPARLIK